jgi:hypothetical protein
VPWDFVVAHVDPLPCGTCATIDGETLGNDLLDDPVCESNTVFESNTR